MSLLTPTTEPTPTPGERKANALKAHIKETAEIMVRRWATGFDLLWRRNNPAATLEALGTDAAECFLRSKLMHEYLIEQYGTVSVIIDGVERNPVVREVLPRLQSLPEFTVHEDGTVTAIFPEPEVPEDPEIELEPAE